MSQRDVSHDGVFRALQEKGIGVGSAVGYGETRGILLYHRSYPRQGPAFYLMGIPSNRFVMTSSPQFLVLLYNPPTTHVHELCTVSRVWNGTWQERKEFLATFLEFARPQIPDVDKITNEFGEYWPRAIVAAMLEQFQQRASRRGDDLKPPKPAEKKKQNYCVVCGTGQATHMFSLKSHVCNGCKDKPIPLVRHCYKCGTLFDATGVTGRAVWICPGCRPGNKKDHKPS